jgi:hypothetical protein
MNGRIPGSKYNPKNHTARFSLYSPVDVDGRAHRRLCHTRISTFLVRRRNLRSQPYRLA